jgi:hypothetical protein
MKDRFQEGANSDETTGMSAEPASKKFIDQICMNQHYDVSKP